MPETLIYTICQNRKRGWRCYSNVIPGFKFCESCQEKKEKEKWEKKLSRLPKAAFAALAQENLHFFSRKKVFIYFIQGINGGPIKIGHTENLSRRLNSLQTSSPVKLQVLHTIKAYMMVEILCHEYFKEIRLHGEWFESTAQLLEFIENAKKGSYPKYIADMVDNPRY